MIKFRVWHKELKIMRDVFSMHNIGSDDLLIITYDFNGDRYHHSWLISEAELMQATGFKSKEGADIFEGDIIYAIHTWGAETLLVKRHPESKQLMLIRLYYKYQEYEDIADYNLPIFTIGGNVWENPDLLELEIDPTPTNAHLEE